MKFLFINREVFTLDLARRLREEGHDVLFFYDPDYRDVYEGIVERVADWRLYTRRRDWIFIFGDTKFGRTQDKLRREGKLVIGGSEGGERLELDRAFGQEMCRQIGLPIVPYRDFRDFDSAIAFVKENPRRWVIKKSGRIDIRTVDYKGRDSDGRDVLARLEFFKHRWNPKTPPHFQLQEFIEGVEVAIGAWFNGNDWVMPYNVNFEHQALMPGDIGPNTGEMYNTMWHRNDRGSRLFQETLEPMTKFFRDLKHVGYIDLNGILNAGGFHPLEWTVRFGMPAHLLQYRLFAGHIPLGEFFSGLAGGTLTKHHYAKTYCVGSLVVAPPFPFPGISAGLLRRHQLWFRRYIRKRSDPLGAVFNLKFSSYSELSRNMPVFFPQDPDFLEHLHFIEVSRKNGTIVTSGTDGICFIVTDTGYTPEEAGSKVLKRIKQIHGLPWIYRNDLGVGESEKLRRLSRYGYDLALSVKEPPRPQESLVKKTASIH